MRHVSGSRIAARMLSTLTGALKTLLKFVKQGGSVDFYLPGEDAEILKRLLEKRESIKELRNTLEKYKLLEGGQDETEEDETEEDDDDAPITAEEG